MSKSLAGFERFVFFLLGLVLIVLGAWPFLIKYEVPGVSPFARDAARWVDHGVWASIPEQGWWGMALVGIAILALFLGLGLLISNLRPHKVNEVTSEASNDDGRITASLQGIAEGIAASIASQPGIESCKRTVAMDRNRPTLTFTITSAAETDLEQVKELAEQTERDFRAALPDVDVDTRYKLHSANLAPS